MKTSDANAIFLCSLLLSGCAGPHTPLGALWSVLPVRAPGDLTEVKAFELENELWSGKIPRHPKALPRGPFTPSVPAIAPEITFSPSRQVLHGPSPFRIVIHDPQGDLEHYQISVKYNSYDVTQAFLNQCKVKKSPKEKILILENPVIRMPAEYEHHIELTYRNSLGIQTRNDYHPPLCSALNRNKVLSTKPFDPSLELLDAIEKASLKQKINPAFFTALIAQESRFEPKLISWAKALGLTQITSSAEQEISQHFTRWPRYPGLEKMSLPRLKVLVLSDSINATNEWRLNTKNSIQGGLYYTQVLLQRWAEHKSVLKIIAEEDDLQILKTRLTLASYHSGFTRVLRAIEKYDKKWLQSPDLKEARKYLNRIFSYCHFFGEKGFTDDLST